jgi:hypothetical protein
MSNQPDNGLRWIVECRNPDGTMDLEGRQPHSVFGVLAMTGMKIETLKKIILEKHPCAVLRAETITAWPSIFDSRWRAKLKTW